MDKRGLFQRLAELDKPDYLRFSAPTGATKPAVELLPTGWHAAECVAASERQDKRGREYWLISFRTRRSPHRFAYARLFKYDGEFDRRAARLLLHMLSAAGYRELASPREFIRCNFTVLVEESARTGFRYVKDVRPARAEAWGAPVRR